MLTSFIVPEILHRFSVIEEENSMSSVHCLILTVVDHSLDLFCSMLELL